MKCDDFHIVGTESGMPESRDIEDYIVSSDKSYSIKEKDCIINCYDMQLKIIRLYVLVWQKM